MLEDIRLTDEYKAIKLFNYKSDDFLEAIKQCKNSFIEMCIRDRGKVGLIQVVKRSPLGDWDILWERG